MKGPILLLLGVLGLAACTDREPDPAPETPDPSVFDPLTGTLDRARGVEDTLGDSAAERRRQLEEAEGR
jgi:hypothetical protein